MWRVGQGAGKGGNSAGYGAIFSSGILVTTIGKGGVSEVFRSQH